MLQFQPVNLELLRREFEVLTIPNPDVVPPELLADVEVAFAPLGSQWDKCRIDRASRLRVIASNTTGVSHIDVAYAASRGIQVVSLKDEQRFLRGITATAELTWGLVLAVVRRIPSAFQAVCEGTWDRRPFGGPAMLSRMSLGIVGLGRLGMMVASYARAFGMKVRYFDRHSSKRRVAGASPLRTLEALVRASDIVTIHVPLDETTVNLFDATAFSWFRPGSFLVNTSRGEVVDADALLTALESGRLRGAALDVLPGEFERGFSVASHHLVEYARKHDNLVITPHIGGSTKDAWRLTEEYTIRRVLQVLKA